MTSNASSSTPSNRLADLLEAHKAPLIRIDGQTSTARRPMATAIITSPDGVQEWDTLMCIHCQYHWRVMPGSGRQRGWCNSCNGALCGKEQCMTVCAHFMKQIEAVEAKGRIANNMALLRR